MSTKFNLRQSIFVMDWDSCFIFNGLFKIINTYVHKAPDKNALKGGDKYKIFNFGFFENSKILNFDEFRTNFDHILHNFCEHLLQAIGRNRTLSDSVRLVGTRVLHNFGD